MISYTSHKCICRLVREWGERSPGSPGLAGLAVFWVLPGSISTCSDSGSSSGIGLLVATDCTFGGSDLGCFLPEMVFQRSLVNRHSVTICCI